MKLFLAFMFDEMHGIGGPFDMRGRFQSLEEAKAFLSSDIVFDTHAILDAACGTLHVRKRVLGTDHWQDWTVADDETLAA
jgi:hypothetical protein